MKTKIIAGFYPKLTPVNLSPENVAAFKAAVDSTPEGTITHQCGLNCGVLKLVGHGKRSLTVFDPCWKSNPNGIEDYRKITKAMGYQLIVPRHN